MKIGILGAGLMGSKLGTLWARSGHDVVFSYARDRARLANLARDAGARAGSPADAAQQDAVLVAVNWPQLADVLAQAGTLAHKVVITCSLPMVDGELVHANTWSGAEELARQLPDSRVVAAFGTVPSECFFGVHANPGRAHMIYYGDDTVAKTAVVPLIRDIGFEPLDLGPLKMARRAEPFTLLMGQLAYERDTGPEVAYRFEWFPS